MRVAKELSLKGHLVISLGLFGHADGLFKTVITTEIKEMLTRVHMEKIDLSDAIVVINTGGYVGSGTKNEIEYAILTGKKVIFMNDEHYIKITSAEINNIPR
jgi:nucleoside 2-deoxyribosyltransferase